MRIAPRLHGQGNKESMDTDPIDPAQHPQAADALQQLFVDGDFSGLRRFAAGLQKVSPGGPLADLVRHAAQPPLDGGVAGTGASGSPAELKTARNFRTT